jgi:GT2 family glycosyltransferase
MKLSYVIVTHNRRESLLRTLGILFARTPLPPKEWEAYVVDNGSKDGTLPAVREQFPLVRTIRRPRNEGVWSRNYAFGVVHAPYIVLLDDDSYPLDGAVVRSIEHLESHHSCAAVAGRVIHPDGTAEACALPNVMLSGAVCLRNSVLDQVGGFAREFFRKAGEYDLSFRIWEAGYSIDRVEDVVYCHDKSPAARSDFLAHRMDLRNNLILAERYLPEDLCQQYRQDWTQRYMALASKAGCGLAARVALCEARVWRMRERMRGRSVLSPKTVETIFHLDSQAAAIADWATQGHIHSVAIADFGKNIYATYRGCVAAGLEITAILDPNPAYKGLFYRGIPVCLQAPAQGVVIANINPAQIDGIERRLQQHFAGPILRLWETNEPQIIRQAA